MAERNAVLEVQVGEEKRERKESTDKEGKRHKEVTSTAYSSRCIVIFRGD